MTLAAASALGGATGLDFERVLSFVATGFAAGCALFGAAVAGLEAGVAFTGPVLWLTAALGFAVAGRGAVLAVSLSRALDLFAGTSACAFFGAEAPNFGAISANWF